MSFGMVHSEYDVAALREVVSRISLDGSDCSM